VVKLLAIIPLRTHVNRYLQYFIACHFLHVYSVIATDSDMHIPARIQVSVVTHCVFVILFKFVKTV